jgi:hypothetical protein
MHREISYEDQEWFLHTHGQKFAEAQFAELDDHPDQPCSPAEDFFITALSIVFAISPILVFIAFALS